MNNSALPTTKRTKHRFPILILILVFFGSLLFSCSQYPETFTPNTPTLENIQPTLKPTIAVTSTPQLLSPPFLAWVDPALPVSVGLSISRLADFNIASSREQSQMTFSSARSDQPVGSWTYLLVAPFYSNLENIQFSDLSSVWKSGTMEFSEYNKLLISEDTKTHLSQFWGAPNTDMLSIIEPDLILENIWFDSAALAIIPFELLEPSYKVISIDNQNPLSSSASDDPYPLTFPIYLTIPDPSLYLPFQVADITNLDHTKLTSVALTGVTALVRDTAVIMEENGFLYPAEDIRDILLSADITHINNEVPFAVDCPPPTSEQDSLSFCSSDAYIELLVSIGTDVVELSGDHFADHGPAAMYHSLDIYKEFGLPTYGGGETLQDGLDPLLIEHNGNQFAFIGCNAKSADRYATASSTNPGASKCDFDWMVAEILRLSEAGYLVIATMQHEEVDSFFPIAYQLYDFQMLSNAGAVIVSGSQAHHPQGFEITDSKFIHYGLGNLFFDQWRLATSNPKVHQNKDKSFIDLHYFYDGTYINSTLIPLQFIDNARPRFMTEEEKTPFLEDIYYASKWNGRWIYLYPAGFFNHLENQ